jgi:hypothetical protein
MTSRIGRQRGIAAISHGRFRDMPCAKRRTILRGMVSTTNVASNL